MELPDVPIDNFLLFYSFVGMIFSSGLIPYSYNAFLFFSAISSSSSLSLILIFIALLFPLGNIIYLLLSYYFVNYSLFLSYFTLSAYLNVFKVFYELAEHGDILPIITVRQNPINESLRHIVNFEPRNGTWFLP
jgi:hypothetical protein